MKKINPSIDQLPNFISPELESEPSDFIRLPGESRLRSLAKTIPSHSHHQLEASTQAYISATLHATQEYLTQVVEAQRLHLPCL